MNFVVIFAMASLLLVAFVNLQKKIHPYEHVFVWSVFVFVFVNATDMAIPLNGEFLKISSDALLYAAQRLWEIVLIPLVILLYLESAQRVKTWRTKIAAFLACYVVLYGLEVLAVRLNLISYVHWRLGWSLLTWFVTLCLVLFLQMGMRKVMRREGIRS